MSCRSARTLVRLNQLSSSSPVASTSTLKPRSRAGCRGCKTSAPFSTTAASPPLVSRESASGTGVGAGRSEKHASSWSTISNALFSPSATTTTTRPSASPTAEALVAELKGGHGDANRAWTLFSQLDYEGATYTLPHFVFHALIAALQPPVVQTLDAAKKSNPLSLARATARAKDYEAKVERIRTRQAEAGGTANESDFANMIHTYYLLGYAPGACHAWDAMLDAGWAIKPRTASQTFGAIHRWVDLHQQLGGKELAKVAAQPLVNYAIAIVAAIENDRGHVLRKGAERDQGRRDQARRTALATCVPELFDLLSRARDVTAFKLAMKNSYGFDMDFPGAVVNAPVPASASERRTLGEEQIRWIFDLYSDEGTPRALSSMITIFEVCDNPAPAASAEPPFFGASFPATLHAIDPDAPPLVGTRALSAIVDLAGKLDQGRIVRHYFDLLYWRWALSADRKIRDMEELVGIEWQGKVTHASDEASSGMDAAPRTTTASTRAPEIENASPVEPATAFATAVDSMTTSPSHEPVLPIFAEGPQALRRDYRMSSRFVADAIRQAKARRDSPTASLLRRRMNRILRLSEEHTVRLAAVLDRLEPAPEPTESATQATPVDAAVTRAPPPSRSLNLLSHELSATLFHQIQLRLIHSRIKADATAVYHYGKLRTLVAQLGINTRRLQDVGKQSGAQVIQMRAALRRKENQVLRMRMTTARAFITRLQLLGLATPGNRQYDEQLSKWHAANQQLISKGQAKESEAEHDGWEPEDAVAGKAQLAQAA